MLCFTYTSSHDRPFLTAFILNAFGGAFSVC